MILNKFSPRRVSWLLIAFVTYLLCLTIYSYSLIDPNLTLLNHPYWELFRNASVQFGYLNRHDAWLTYCVLIILAFFLHSQIQKSIKFSPLILAGIIAGITVFAYPYASHDLFNYIFDARIFTHYGLNPYTHIPGNFADDPWLRFMHWTHRTYPYGPSFLPISIIVSFLSLNKLVLNFLFFKGLFALAYFGSVWSLTKMKRSWGLYFATHPLIIYEGLINAHNDLLAVYFAILAISYLYHSQSHTGSLKARVALIVSAGINYILDPETSKNRIEWIELRQDGKQMLQSVPERVSEILEESLYTKFAVTLCIPPESDDTLNEIIGRTITTNLIEQEKPEMIPLEFAPSKSPQDILKEPREGKTVLLVASRKLIENIFITYAEALEEKGVTLICQGLSGGQGRMQAEYIAAEGTAILVTTPWTFEGFELHQNTIDHLVIDTLPFDHPSHAVISKRAEHYQNAFEGYSLPRLEHRLFRLLRTFCRYASNQGNVVILDDRLESKSYGKRIHEYLGQFAGAARAKAPAQKKTTKKAPKKNTDQLELF